MPPARIAAGSACAAGYWSARGRAVAQRPPGCSDGRMTKTRILIPLAVVASAAAILPATGSAATREGYCSPSGDVCYGVVQGSSPIKLRLVLQAKYFNRYKLCVRGPNNIRECKRFKIRKRKDGTFGSTVNVAKHFNFQGKGTYRARYSQGGHSLGPAITY